MFSARSFVTVVGALALVFGALLLASGIGAVLHFIDVFIYDLSWFPSIDPTDKNSGFQLILLGYIIDIAAITAGVWIGTEERRRIWTNRRRAKRAAAENVEPVYKEPSVVGQWLKDRHDKVCRQLSFTTPNATNDYT